MLKQCECRVEPYDIASAEHLGDSASVEPKEESKTKRTENVGVQLGEDISTKVDPFGSEGDEEDDKCWVPSGKHTVTLSEETSRGKTASDGLCLSYSSKTGTQLTTFNTYNGPREKQGLGLMRLLQFSGTLSRESPQKHHLSYWDDLIREYFTPGAIMKLTLWEDNQNEAKPFDISVAVLPRFFLVTTQSGVKSMTLSLDSAEERISQSGHTIVECLGASWTYQYRNGYRVTLRGPLTVHVIASSRIPPPGNTQSDFIFKFDEFQFDARFHDKSIALEAILGARSIENLPPSMTAAPNPSERATAGIGSASQIKCNQQHADDERNWEEPRVLIDYASFSGEPVNSFGIPRAAMRCLEIAKSVTSMAELIQFANESSLGPVDALKEFATRLRESGADLPSRPPVILNLSSTVSSTTHSGSASSSTTQPKQAGDTPTIGNGQQQKRMTQRTGTVRKRAKMEPSTNSSTTNGRRNLSLLPTMPLDILFEILGHLPPKDILSVSRASKIFHETLMSRSATTVWKAARDRLDAPECPNWMSEPAWAALLFGHICQSCGTSNIHNVDFLLLKRACALCKKTHLLLRSKIAARYPGILNLVPSTNVSAWFHGRAGNNYYYWDTDLEGMVEKLLKLEADVKKDLPNSQKKLFDFKEEHKQRTAQIQQASPQWQAWSHAFQLERITAKREAQNRRIEQIKEKFRELGYTDEDLSFPRNQKEFCSTAPLTEKSWKRIRPKLEPQAIARKADRLQKEALRIRSDRRRIIYLRYKDYQRTLHPSQWKYLPHTRELTSYEPFARHVEAPVEVEVTVATFDEAFAYLPEFLVSAMEERKKSLRDLLPNRPNGDEKIDENHDPMVLAMAAFRCEWDSAFLFGWDEVASHHCQEQAGSLWEYNANLEPQTTTPPVAYCPFASNVVKHVAKLVGLDYATVTPAELDEADFRFSCHSCGSYREGVYYYEPGYDWRSLADHLHIGLTGFDNLKVLSSGAAEVRQCEREEKWMARRWTCTHCPEHLGNLQTRQVVFRHLLDSHAIETPSEPTDLLFFERHRKAWVNQPRFTVYKTAEPTPLFRCLLCPGGNTSDSSYILPNIEGHLKQVHQVIDAEAGVDYEAIASEVLKQPLLSVRTVRYHPI